MQSATRILRLFLPILFATKAYSLAITSKPVLIAFAKRATDHPYAYQVTTDAGDETVVYSLENPPEGMSISTAGKISWVPLHSQAYDNPVTVKAAVGDDEATQSFKVFVLGITKAARNALKPKNQAWVASYHAITPGTERPNYHMIMYIGDSQSMSSHWGSAILGASTWHDETFPHYPRFWGSYRGNESVCQELSNGNDAQSAMRSSGHSREYGNLSSQQANFGVSIVRTAVTNTCTIGAATATVAFGHNDAAVHKDASTFTSQMSAIADSLLAFNIIPILFTVSPGVSGGNWGSSTALTLYPKYRDSVVAMCKRRNLPCIDVYSAVQTSLNSGAASSLASMYNDDVHYKYDESATSRNPLHNEANALNLVNHMLAHMLGYLYESGIHAPVRDTFAAPFYPQGLPKDPDRSPTYLTDYGDEEGTRVLPAPSGFGMAKVAINPVSGREITFAISGVEAGAYAAMTFYDFSGKRVKRISSGSKRAGSADLTLTWNGQTESGGAAPAGMYLAQVQVGHQTFSKKVMLFTGRN